MLLRFSILVSQAVLVLFMQTAVLQAQCGSSDKTLPRTIPTVSQETYNRVLEILLPIEYPSPDKTDFFIALRFQPSFSRTSQITIRNDVEKTEVIEYAANVNVYDELNKILAETCLENPEEMAKLIKVEKKKLDVPPLRVKQWHINFLRSLSSSLDNFRQRSEQRAKDGTVSIILDGTSYKLWYMQGGDKIEIEFYDAEIDDPKVTGNFKLVQWMNTVRQQVRK